MNNAATSDLDTRGSSLDAFTSLSGFMMLRTFTT